MPERVSSLPVPQKRGISSWVFAEHGVWIACRNCLALRKVASTHHYDTAECPRCGYVGWCYLTEEPYLSGHSKKMLSDKESDWPTQLADGLTKLVHRPSQNKDEEPEEVELVLPPPPPQRSRLEEILLPVSHGTYANEQAAAHGITSKERQVLLLAAEGLNNRETADALHVSEETIKSHFRHISGKLNARSKLHALCICFRARIIE